MVHVLVEIIGNSYSLISISDVVHDLSELAGKKE